MTVVDAATHAPVSGWPEAVRAAAQLLVAKGTATPDYPQACVDVIREHGPYIVLTPGLALVHARPDTGGTRMGVAVLRLDKPVEFGHEANDPVDLLVAFSSPDDHAHVATMSRLAQALGSGLAEQLRKADDDSALRQAMKEALGAD